MNEHVDVDQIKAYLDLLFQLKKDFFHAFEKIKTAKLKEIDGREFVELMRWLFYFLN